MLFHVDSPGNRLLAGIVLLALGVAFLVAGVFYRDSIGSSAADPLTGPLVEGLFLLSVLLPIAFIAMGLFMVIRARWLFTKAARSPAGIVDRRDR